MPSPSASRVVAIPGIEQPLVDLGREVMFGLVQRLEAGRLLAEGADALAVEQERRRPAWRRWPPAICPTQVVSVAATIVPSGSAI